MKIVWLALALWTASAEEPSAPIDGNPQAEASLPPPGPPPRAEDIEAITIRVSQSLRCPVCQGLSVADSPSESARGMKDRVRELVAAGYTDDQIRDYFVVRYGEWVLLAPPVATNLLVWAGPGFAVGLGLAILAATVLRWRRESEETAPAAVVDPTAMDEYERRLLEEIEK